jgi:hypothetical protein
VWVDGDRRISGESQTLKVLTGTVVFIIFAIDVHISTSLSELCSRPILTKHTIGEQFEPPLLWLCEAPKKIG